MDLYRGQEPAFCRGCGVEWTPGADRCGRCGEPAQPPTTSDGFGRALPAFTDQRRLVGVLGVLGAIYGLMLVVSLGFTWFDHGVFRDLVHGVDVPMATIERIDADIPFNVLSMVVFLGLVVLFGVWLVRAGRNLRARGILDTRETDETRLLWFFVPIVHLYRPLSGMAELWRGSTAEDPAHWRNVAFPWLLAPWWALWLVANALENVMLYVRYEAVTAQELLHAAEYDMASTVAKLLCLPLFLVIVRRIDSAQRASRPGR